MMERIPCTTQSSWTFNLKLCLDRQVEASLLGQGEVYFSCQKEHKLNLWYPEGQNVQSLIQFAKYCWFSLPKHMVKLFFLSFWGLGVAM